MAYGRGGAGNIQISLEQQQQQSPALHSVDLEANKPQPREGAAAANSDSTGYPVLSQDLETKASAQQEYAHSGRGGAGNYYSPRELSSTGTFQTSDTNATTASSSTKESGNGESLKYVGRGGAGNYYGYGAESEVRAAQRRKEENDKRDQVRQDIEKGVKATLAMPPRAKLAGAGE